MESLLVLAQDPTAWVALVTLVAMELVLGIDNLIFISILTNRLPEHQRSKARRIGIGMALVMRLLLLTTVAFIVTLTRPVIEILGKGFSWRDIILFAGGLFLIWKATKEIHQNTDPDPEPGLAGQTARLNFGAALFQIVLLDIVFSVDSIITAVGMTDHVPIMVIAVVITVLAMLVAADPLANFIHRNPSLVMLALGFLLLIGTSLVAEAFGAHVPKGYIYSAMAFSALVEGLNMWTRNSRDRKRGTAKASATAEKPGGPGKSGPGAGHSAH